jgi:hypothetical protein
VLVLVLVLVEVLELVEVVEEVEVEVVEVGVVDDVEVVELVEVVDDVEVVEDVEVVDTTASTVSRTASLPPGDKVAEMTPNRAVGRAVDVPRRHAEVVGRVAGDVC